jgi:hypothetical protein
VNSFRNFTRLLDSRYPPAPWQHLREVLSRCCRHRGWALFGQKRPSFRYKRNGNLQTPPTCPRRYWTGAGNIENTVQRCPRHLARCWQYRTKVPRTLGPVFLAPWQHLREVLSRCCRHRGWALFGQKRPTATCKTPPTSARVPRETALDARVLRVQGINSPWTQFLVVPQR